MALVRLGPCNRTMNALLAQSWVVYRRLSGSIVLILLAVWGPLELAAGYVQAEMLEASQIDLFREPITIIKDSIGLLATAAIYALANARVTGQSLGISRALRAGLHSWPALWWTYLISGLAIFGGLLLLILPGLYLMARLSLIGPIVVGERISGGAAMRRSFELTQGRLGPLAAIWLLTFGIASLILIAPGLMLDPSVHGHWAMIAALVVAYGTAASFCNVAFSVVYSEVTPPPSAAEPPALPVVTGEPV